MLKGREPVDVIPVGYRKALSRNTQPGRPRLSLHQRIHPGLHFSQAFIAHDDFMAYVPGGACLSTTYLNQPELSGKVLGIWCSHQRPEERQRGW